MVCQAHRLLLRWGEEEKIKRNKSQKFVLVTIFVYPCQSSQGSHPVSAAQEASLAAASRQNLLCTPCLPWYVANPNINGAGASQHHAAFRHHSPSLPPSPLFRSKEKWKRKPRRKERRAGEPSAEADLLCSHLITEGNFTDENTSFETLSNGNPRSTGKVHYFQTDQ